MGLLAQVALSPLEIMMLIAKEIRFNPKSSPAEKLMETFPLLPQDQQQLLLRVQQHLLLRQQPLLRVRL
jgi:hypothetical protein